jgi:hypothetical protein
MWSIIGTSAALNFGIKEDVGLLISGVTTFALIVYKNKKSYPSANSNKRVLQKTNKS